MDEITVQTNNNNLQRTIQANFEHLMRDFLDTIQVSDATATTYTNGIKQFIDWTVSNGITQPTFQDIRCFVKYLKEAGKKPTTIKSYIASIKALYKYATITGKTTSNITLGIKTPTLSKDFKRDCLTVEQVNDCLEVCESLRDKVIFCLGASLGLRTIEISRLDKSDLQIKAGVPVLYILGKGRSEKEYLPISSKLHKLILQYLNTRKDNSPVLIFATSNRSNGRLAPGSVSRIVKGILEKAGCKTERTCCHALRHTACTLFFKTGHNAREVQAMARHSSLDVTNLYSHDLEKLNNTCNDSVMQLLKV